MAAGLFAGYFQSAHSLQQALINGSRQEAIMQQVMTLPGIEEKWDSPEVEKMILDKLN